jgi:hypothetical protein
VDFAFGRGEEPQINAEGKAVAMLDYRFGKGEKRTLRAQLGRHTALDIG